MKFKFNQGQSVLIKPLFANSCTLKPFFDKTAAYSTHTHANVIVLLHISVLTAEQPAYMAASSSLLSLKLCGA